jgi:hypothetical protein
MALAMLASPVKAARGGADHRCHGCAGCAATGHIRKRA